MEVVFLQDVPNVANAGEVKKVANGYARNFLFPKKLAALATPAELRNLESQRQSDARRQAALGKEAEALAQVLGALTIALKVRVGTKDRIYGSVTSAAIVREIKRLSGHAIDKHNIELEEPIRELGSHQVSIRLTKNVTATVNVLVELAEQEEEKGKKKKETKKAKDKEQETKQKKEKAKDKKQETKQKKEKAKDKEQETKRKKEKAKDKEQEIKQTEEKAKDKEREQEQEKE